MAVATERFADRRDAGRRLAAALGRFRGAAPVVLGIPRGGVPVAAEVARALGAPLGVAVVRKIGAPFNPEFAIGAVAEGIGRVLDEEAVGALGVIPEQLRPVVERAEAELAERVARYRAGGPETPVAGRLVIVVDDGLATGHTARAAARSVRARGAARVVLAVPVAASQSVRAIAGEFDEVVAVLEPDDLYAIGLWYEDFSPTSDDEVAALLAAQAVAGDLTVPAAAAGIVVFAHGSGSSRMSPRNRAVAAALNDDGLATLLIDLLTGDEEADRRNVFDVALLASRLAEAAERVAADPATAALPLGFFGASTGAAAALVAAAELGDRVAAVVSRGGRPDLAGTRLAEVVSPTLLIVGGADSEVLALNRLAQRELRCPNRLEVIPGATHLFEEPGAMQAVTRLASGWFRAQFQPAA